MSRLALSHILGSSWLEFAHTAHGTVVTCPACGAREFFPWTDEPVLAHRSACPVLHAAVAARRAFIDMSGSAWLA